MKKTIEIDIPEGYEINGNPFLTMKDNNIIGIGFTLKKVISNPIANLDCNYPIFDVIGCPFEDGRKCDSCEYLIKKSKLK